MEKEKFDKLLRDKIATHDQNFKRSFDTEKSWNAIREKKGKKLWYQLSAAIAIAVLSSILFFQKNHQPMVNEMSKIGKHTTIDSLPKPIQQYKKAIVSNIKLHGSQEKRTAFKPAIELVSVQKNSKPDTTVTGLSQAISKPEALVVNTSAGSRETTDIKITFKRGEQINAPDIKVSLTRGQKIKFDFFKKEKRYDSSEYVLNTKPKQSLKLNF